MDVLATRHEYRSDCNSKSRQVESSCATIHGDGTTVIQIGHAGVILTAWFPPHWAVIGPLHFRTTPNHVWGNPLDNSKTKEIYKSIADYIQYLKDEYGVEIADFFLMNLTWELILDKLEKSTTN